MSWVSIVLAEATTNLVEFPSVEDADIASFVAVNVATRARSATQSKWGAYSLAITPHVANADSGVYYQVTGAVTTTYTFSVWVYGANGVDYRIRLIDGAAATLATEAFAGTGAWQYVEVTGTTAANATVRCYLTKDTGWGAVFYADGWQLEQKAYATTYADGDQPGCEWAGAVHASTSSRSAQSRAGGRVINLTDYDICVDTISGMGYPPVRHNVRNMALQPGALMDNVKVRPRVITLRSVIHETDGRVAVHSDRKDLIDLIKSDAVATLQPFILRYNAMTTDDDPYANAVECYAYYDSGMEGRWQDKFREEFGLRMIAYDPFWYGVGEDSAVLDSIDSFVNSNYIMGRIDGYWNDISNGTDDLVRNILLAPDGTLYVAGNFHNAGGAAAWHIASWDGTAWSPLGAGLNGNVWALALGPDGDLYAGGFFTDLQGGGLANANYIARWDGANWNAMNIGMDSVVYDIAVGGDGTVYAVGGFTLAGGNAVKRIAQWDGANWAVISADDLAGSPNTIAIGLDGYIYVGGDFHSAGGVTAYHMAFWDGAAWNAMGPGLDALPYEITVATDNRIYVGGDFVNTFDSSVVLNYIGVWNGESWEPLGIGMNGDVRSISIGPDGLMHVGGNFTEAGGIATPDHLARWDGSTWSHWDIDLPGAPRIWKVLVGKSNPVVPSLYDLYVGFTTSGTAQAAGLVTIDNVGSAISYPQIVISRSAGTSATLEFIRNETTGRVLLFERDILDGEVLTIDLTPGAKTATSNFFGNIIGSVFPNTDFATFSLIPGDNVITCYISEVGNPTIVAYMVWKVTNWSAD